MNKNDNNKNQEIEKNIEDIELENEVEDKKIDEVENTKREIIEQSDGLVEIVVEDKKVKIDKKPQRKYGTIALITTIIITVIIVVINLIATDLQEKYPISTDVTTDGLYDLDEKTTDFLNALDKPITITVLAEEEFFAQVSSGDVEGSLPKISNMIKRYAQTSPNIKLSYINITEDPTLSNQNPELSLAYGDILVKSDLRAKVLKLDDLLVLETDYQTGQQYLGGYKVEETLSLAIMAVVSEDLNKAVVLTGFEMFMEPTGITSLLSINNYEIEEVSIMTQEIPQDADIVILSAPTRDFTEDEIKKIDKFLDNNGELDKTFYYLPYFTPESETKNIDGLLADWGIEVEKDYVYELDENRLIQMNPPYLSFLADYKDGELSAGLEQKPYIVSVSFPINLLYETSGNRATKVMLETSEKSYLRPIDSEEFTYETQGESGPFNIMAIGEKTISGSSIKTSRIIVNSSAASTSKTLMEEKRFGNAEYTINMFNKFHPNEYDFTVTPKNINDYNLPLTTANIRFYFSLFLIVIPLTILITGFVIWFRRLKR